MIDLSNTTLVAIGSTKTQETLRAIEICASHCMFKDIVFFTDQETPYSVPISPMSSIKDYDNFVVKKLPYKVDSDYILTVHWDGFIVNPDAWTDDFFSYDYIGAPWPWMNHICGNGGFCLKSKRFLSAQKEIIGHLYPDRSIEQPDDLVLSYYLRNYFIQKGCSYAPPNIAYKFSTEYGWYDNYKSFGFHDLEVNPQFIKYHNNYVRL